MPFRGTGQLIVLRNLLIEWRMMMNNYIFGEDDVVNEQIDFSKELIMDDIKELFSF